MRLWLAPFAGPERGRSAAECAQHNKSIQAQQKNGEAEKIGIEAENSLEDPTVEYSSFFSKGVSGQSGSELVVSQGFDFPTVYNSRNRAGRDKKEAVDYRAEALRRNVLLEAKTLCLDMIRLNRQRDLLDKRMQNADELLALYEERLRAGDATVIEVNKIKMERMSIQTEVLQNHTDHRTALQSLLALNGNMPLTFEGREYPTIPTTLDFEALCDEVLGQDAELKAAEADTRAAERNLTVNRQKWLPKLEIGYRRNTGEGSKEHGFLVGGSIPLFSNRRQENGTGTIYRHTFASGRNTPESRSRLAFRFQRTSTTGTSHVGIRPAPDDTDSRTAEKKRKRRRTVRDGLLCGSRPDLPQPASLHGTGMPISESGSHAV